MKVSWDGMFKSVSLGVLALSLTLFLGACGGGGGGGGGGATGGGADPNPKLSGTVAEGAAIGSATITFLDESGNTTDVVTEADGSYSVDLKALGLSRPVMAQVIYGDGEKMYSYAGTGDDVCNIHPFTDMILRTWFEVLAPVGVDSISDAFDSGASFDLPSETEVDIIKAVVTSVVNDILVAALGEEGAENFDLIETEFGVTGGGFDGVLDDTNVNVSDTTGELSVTVIPGSDLETAVESEGGSTSITMDTGAIDVEGTDSTAPAAPTSLAALASGGQLLLTWSAPTKEADEVTDLTDLAGYKIYNNTTSIATVTSTMFILPTVPASYSITVKAFDGASPANLSVASSAVTSSTPDASGVPGDVVFSNTSSPSPVEVLLSWTPIVDDDLIGYAIYRDTTAVQPATPIANIPADGAAGTRTFVDFGLTHSTPYYYWVVAEDAAGNSSTATPSGAITTLTPVATTPVETPVLLNLSALGADTVKLTWDNYSTAGDLAGFFIYRNTSTVGVAPATATTYIDTNGLVADTTYAYRIAAFDPAGDISSQSVPITPVTTQPLAAADVSYFLTLARQKLENNDITGAETLYTEAVTVDATNPEANFGLAITEMATLVEDPALITFFEAYSAYAPAAEQLIYGLFSSNYEVYGSDVSPDTYDRDAAAWDPTVGSFTKLGIATQFTSNQYYMIRTSPFNEVELNISGDRLKVLTDSNFNTTFEQYTGFSGEVMQVNGYLGGTSIYYDFVIIEAAYDNTINITSLAGGTQQKVSAASAEDGSTADHALMVLDKAKTVFGSLPKGETSLLTKMKVATKTMLDGPPDVLDMQTVAKDAIIPTLTSVISHLRAAQGKGLKFVVTPAMTGDAAAEGVVFDDGEFYALDALLSLVNSMMYVFTAYDLTADLSVVEADPLSLLDDPNFFTLQVADGLTRAASARTALQDFAAKAESAYAYVFSEWGYTTYVPNANDSWGNPCQDSVMKPTKDPLDGGVRLHDDFNGWDACNPYSFREEDDDIAKAVFDLVPMVLAGQVTIAETVTTGCSVNCDGAPNTRKITVSGVGGTVVIDEHGTYDSADSFSISADITKMFTNPLTRANLPTLAYDLTPDATLSSDYDTCVVEYLGPGYNAIQGDYDDDLIWCEVYPTSDIPDYTLNGINPGGLSAIPEFGGILYLDQAFGLATSTHIKDDASAANDGTDLYVLNEEWVDATYPTYQKTVFQISTTGTVLNSWPLAFTNSTSTGAAVANTVGNYLNDVTWHGGELWGTGSYNDGTGTMQSGAFRIDYVNGLVDATKQLPVPAQTSCGPTCWTYTLVGGIASDTATNLYVSLSSTDCYDAGPCYDSYNSGIGKFDPSGLSVLPTTRDIYIDDDELQTLFYGGGYLWTDYADVKIDPATGNTVMEYGGMEYATTYLNGGLYYVGNFRVHRYLAP